MRRGYEDNEKLAEYVEATPRLARPIIETLTIEASDLKDTKDEFSGATPSGGGGLTSKFTIFDEGGCRLYGTGETDFLSSDKSVDTSADISSLVPPTQSPLGVAVVELGGNNQQGREIWGAKAYLDPNTGSGKEVDFWYCNLYQFEGIDINGNEEAWNLRLIASARVAATATTAGDVAFSFANAGTIPVVGDPPDVSDPRIGAGLSIKGATVVMMVYAIKGNGEVAGNVKWRCNSGASSVTSLNHTIYRYNLTALDSAAESSTLRYTAASAVGVPDMSFTGNEAYSTATIEWVDTGNKLDLGQTPASGTDLELTLQTATPSDTSVTAEIYNDADATWYTFVDNDIIGEDRSSEGGSDLSAMTRQQSYKVKATLTTSTDTSHTPRLYRIGVQELTSEVVDGLVDVLSANWAIDPITSQSEIPTMSLTLHRDGEKDYRSWSDELFSTNQLNELLFRVWVGHPDLEKRYWLHIDDFIVGNYSPTESGINAELLSPLQYALAQIPPKVGGTRAPKAYSNETLKSVYADILAAQVGIQTRYIGASIEDEDSSNNVTKTLAVEEQAVDVLRQLNFINGSATISSQGVLKVVPLFEGQNPSAHASFPYDELTVLSTDTGFDRRITTFDVPYGWDGNKYENEQEAKPSQDVIDRLGPIAASQATQLDDGVARWLRTSGHADRIGSRMVTNFLNGLSQIHFRSHTAKPWLEPGDAVAIESDIYVGIDPRNNRALRGRGWSKGIVTQCHDVMGHEFTVWVQSWYDIIATNTQFSWDAGMTPGGKMLWEAYNPIAEATQALWRAEFGTQAITITAGAGLTGGGDLTANRTIAMSRYGFETLGDPATAHSGKDVIPFYDNSQTSFDWLLLDTSDFAISAGTLSLTSGASGLTGTSTGLTDDGTDASVKYTATSNLIDGAADSGDIAAADLILYRDDDTGIVRKDTVGALPFTNNAGTVTSVSGTGMVSGLTLSGTVTSSGNIELGGTLSVNESDIVDGSILARLAADETVSGTYSFSAAPRLNAGLDLQNESSGPSVTAGYQTLYSYNNGSTFELRTIVSDSPNPDLVRNIPLVTGSAGNDQLLVSTGNDHEADWSGDLTYNASSGLDLGGTGLDISISGTGRFEGDGSGLTGVAADSSTVTDLTTETNTYYPMMADGTSGSVSHFVDASEMSYTSSTDTLNLVSAVLSGDLTVDTSTLVVDSTNNRVGIGTASPGTVFHVQSGSANPARIITSSITNSSLLIGNTSTGSAVLTLDGANGDAAGADYFTIQQNNDLTANIYTQANAGVLTLGSKGTSNAITIDGANVGIGTASPADKLEVVGNVLLSDGSPEITFETGAAHYNWQIAAQENVNAGFEISVGSADGDASNDTFTPVATFTQAGNVGIGTTSPSAPLEVNGNGAAFELDGPTNGSYIQWRDAGTLRGYLGTANHLVSGASSASMALRAENQLLFSIGNAEAMRIDSSGNVLLNYSTGNKPALTPTRFGYSTSYPVLMLSPSSGSPTVSIGYDPIGNTSGAFSGDGREVLFRNGVEFTTPNASNTSFNRYHLVLKDGNVGIGTHNPLDKLHVAGSTTLEGSVDQLLVLNQTSATGQPYIAFKQNGTRRSYIQHADSGDDLRLVSEYGPVELWSGVSGTEYMKLQVDAIGSTTGRAFFLNTQVYNAEGAEITRSTAGSVTLNWDAYNQVDLRNDGNIDTINIDDNSMQDGGHYCLVIRYATSGQTSITFSASGSLYWQGGSAPTLPNATVGDRTVITFVKTGGITCGFYADAPV